MTHVQASFAIGFHSTESDEAVRTQHKGAVLDEFDDRVDPAKTAHWNLLTTHTDANPPGHKADAAVEAEIDTLLLSSGKTGITITRAALHSVTYIHYDSVRYCQHNYELMVTLPSATAASAWQVPDTAIPLLGQFTWSTPINEP